MLDVDHRATPKFAISKTNNRSAFVHLDRKAHARSVVKSIAGPRRHRLVEVGRNAANSPDQFRDALNLALELHVVANMLEGTPSAPIGEDARRLDTTQRRAHDARELRTQE